MAFGGGQTRSGRSITLGAGWPMIRRPRVGAQAGGHGMAVFGGDMEEDLIGRGERVGKRQGAPVSRNHDIVALQDEDIGPGQRGMVSSRPPRGRRNSSASTKRSQSARRWRARSMMSAVSASSPAASRPRSSKGGGRARLHEPLGQNSLCSVGRIGVGGEDVGDADPAQMGDGGADQVDLVLDAETGGDGHGASSCRARARAVARRSMSAGP